ncbi:hypothetical protein BC833DRAFT_599837 [Globomyces pollinis-pini]|nr:hypothetical protein BC833DRAFT_599837 [Globomyces pollinis-pini]
MKIRVLNHKWILGVILGFISIAALLLSLPSSHSRVAVLVIGGPRSFSAPSIHKSILAYIKSLAIDPDFFFQLADLQDSTCDQMLIKYPHFSLHNALSYFTYSTKVISWDNPSCDEPNIKDSSCCGRENNPHYWTSYMRKVSAYNNVHQYELRNGFEYDWYIFIRPDLFFFEDSIVNLSTLNKNRIYISSKEMGEPLGDFIYMVPNNLIKHFVSSVVHHNDQACTEGREPDWPPEYQFDPFIYKHHNLPHQILPILFTIARCNGKADCFRLNNEVLHKLHLLHDGKLVTPEYYCNLLVNSSLLLQ